MYINFFLSKKILSEKILLKKNKFLHFSQVKQIEKYFD